jgi:uncharacterized protein YndB with AHSA1/START domain
MNGHVLSVSRRMQARPAQVFACWTSAERLARWFCPRPWQVTDGDMAFHVGGHNHAIMRGPDGGEAVHRSVFLEIVPDRRIVFTDAYERAWVPSASPFITAEIDLAETEGGGTHVTVTVRHWTEADKDRHAAMGFIPAWTAVLAQMEEVALTL